MASPRKVITEYLATISPSYNKQQWDSAASKMGDTLQSTIGKQFLTGADKQIKELEKKLNVLKQKRDLISKSIASTSQSRDSVFEEMKSVKDSTQLSDEEKQSRLSELQKQYDGLSEILSKQRKAQGDTIQSINSTSSKLEGLNGKVGDYGGKISKASGYLAAFSTAVNLASEAAEYFVNKATESSNKFVSSNSIFFDEGIRDLQAKYGISNTQAQSMSASMDALGIDVSDFAKLPEGTRKAFDELMQHYQDGLNSIDPDKLDRFNDATQEFQLMQAKFQMDVQLAWTKLLANSDALPDLLETLGNALEGITDILGSEAFQVGGDILIGVINGILEFVTTPLNLLGKVLKGGSDNSTTNNNATTNNNNITVNTNSGISGQQLALDISMQLQNVTTP